MADAHAARDHATWSASSTERNWACPGALALTIGLPETTSEAADWGTCCHEVAENCLFNPTRQADEYIGQTLKGKSHSFEVDEEMAETAQMYVDYVRKRVADYKAETGQNALIFVEERFSLEALKPPFDAGGISDCTIIFPKWKLIETIDLKGGRGHVVEVIGNPQARTYSLGALMKHQGHDITRVMSTIVQPRAPHKDGRIRSETFHIADLVEWTTDLVAAMRRAKDALVSLPGGPPVEVISKDSDTGEELSHYENLPPATWAKTHLRAGDHCKFCKAKATCPAIEQKVIDQVGVWFEDTGAPRLANDPAPDDPEKVARDLDMLDMIEGWCNARREHAHRLAENGVAIPNYILVPKQGREKWKDEGAAVGQMRGRGVHDETFLNDPKLRTPKQVRAALKKLGLAVSIDDLAATPDAGTNLVRADKTTRAPVQGTAARFFEPSTD